MFAAVFAVANGIFYLVLGRNLWPLWKYSFPTGEQIYVSSVTGEVVDLDEEAGVTLSGPPSR